MKNQTLLLAFLILFISCKVTHNIPNNQTPNELVNQLNYKIFVDQNGDYYPNNWEANFGKQPRNAAGKKGAYSLTLLAKNQKLKDELKATQVNALQGINTKFQRKKRIFILVHGYNNCETKAKESFDLIKNKINFNTEEDAVIDFYWDGMVAKGTFGSVKIWFYATGYSQLAGERGLRKILNLFNNKEIIMISHSRGASVVLSALSDPPYSPDFAKQTLDIHKIKVQTEEKLKEQNNKIKIVMLAPAIGQIDFRKPEYYTSDKNSFRTFSDQLKLLHITVNKNDKILKKYVKKLKDKLNPTDLGYDINQYKILKKNYPIMQMTSFDGLNSHAFKDYIGDSKFNKVLKSLDIELKN